MSHFDLPSSFESLAAFKDWAIDTEQGRHERRLAMPLEAWRGASSGRGLSDRGQGGVIAASSG